MNINIIGLDKLIKDFEQKPVQFKKEVTDVLRNGAKTFVRNAQRDAPRDMGFLANLISFMQVGELTFMVISASRYSPYLEWGTITRVSVPGDQQEYAIQFKGKGIRKNGGIFPHPYFFRQGTPVRIQVAADLKQIGVE